MAYFSDGTAYSYLANSKEDAINVGWLDSDHGYDRGTLPTDLLDLIFELCKTPVRKTRGFHQCPFCSKPEFGVLAVHGTESARLGSAEIRLKCGNVVYAAPDMLFHYVKDHDYLPPAAFVECLSSMAANRGSR
jgi:hypothetical protein